jgi:hypothetical protein
MALTWTLKLKDGVGAAAAADRLRELAECLRAEAAKPQLVRTLHVVPADLASFVSTDLEK